MKYISAPFSNAADKEKRLDKIREYSATLFLGGEHVLCPSTLGNAFCEAKEALKEKNSHFWLTWYEKFFPVITEMDVLTYRGWENSVGVQNEISLAKRYNIKINYIQVNDE